MYISIQEAVDKYSISERAIYRWRMNGTLHSKKVFTKAPCIRKGETTYTRRKMVAISEKDINTILSAPLQQKEQIIEMLAQGQTQVQIANHLSISEGILRTRMRKFGIPPRTRSQAGFLCSTRPRAKHYQETRSNPKERKVVFHQIFDWVNSLTKMPTRDQIEKQSSLQFMPPANIYSLIETRPRRGLSKLREMTW